VFNVDGAVPNLAASATRVSLLASTWARMAIFPRIENAFLFFGSAIVMKKESQPEIKIKLFASLIRSRFTKQHPLSDFIPFSACISRTFFFHQNLPSKMGVRLAHGIKNNQDPPRKSRYDTDD
jgi:hypothetical protein